MEPSSPFSLHSGTLLVATPEVEDTIYRKGVIVICEHTNAVGSFGIMINKPLVIDMLEDVLHIPNLNHPKVRIMCGGKMQPNQMMIMHTSTETSSHTLPLAEQVYLGGDAQFLQNIITDDHCSSIFLCFGYIGWLANELEREVSVGKWLTYRGCKEFIFDTPGDVLWKTLLEQMGGQYKSMASIPDDLSLN